MTSKILSIKNIKKSELHNKSFLITGGTGSFGKKFAQIVLENFKPKKVIIYSRDELKQFNMQNDILFKKYNQNKNSKIRYFIGDIRDKERLIMAMKADIDIVIHAAALKQVPTAEYNPFEAVKTNIIGSQNVIDASLVSNVKKVIALSTDKAAAPINLYGATKLTSDKLFIAANNYKGKNEIKFSVVRYGNVANSRGSVIPLFLDQKNSGNISITDKRMTRFNITLDEGVNFVLNCLLKMWGGELYIPKIPSYRILDVAKAIAPNAKINIVGIRSGEKLHEEMITNTDSLNTIEFNDYYVILPDMVYKYWNKNNFLKSRSGMGGKPCMKDFKYTSDTNSKFMTISEIRKLIKQK